MKGANMLDNQRQLFSLPEDVTYLNCAYTAPLMKKAEAAGRQALAQKAAPWQLTAGHFFETIRENRELFARIISCAPEDVALIPSVSYGISLAARNIPVAAGQKIVLLQNQFPSNVYAWRRRAAETGATLTTVRQPENDDWTPSVLEAIDRGTAIAALPHCHWTDGTLIDLVAVGSRCREVGAALVVDGTQSLGAMPFSVADIQPDFLITTAHKWLLGPYSFGFAYIAPRWQKGVPLEENWLNREGSADFARLVDYRDTYQPGALRFDCGEASNFILAPVAAEALRQILAWEVEAIAATLRTKTDEIANRAREMGMATAPTAFRAPHLIGLRLSSLPPSDLPTRLAQARVFVSVRGSAIRVAPHLYNTTADIERLFIALQQYLP
jgi:selenocysteine lyase/cysteine desulfurase